MPIQIPTLTELLDSPQVRPWVDAANKNVVVTSVKTFVGRVTTELQSRAAEMKIPSVSDLADRVAEWLATRRASAPHPEINATGVLLPEQMSLPLADEALHALQVSLRDYVTGQAPGSGASSQQTIQELVRGLTGAEACVTTGTRSGALLLALATLCGERPVVVARGQVGEIEPGVTLPELACAAHVSLRECGIVERVAAQDYEQSIGGAGAILYLLRPQVVANEETLALIKQLAAIGRQYSVPVIVDLGLGGIASAEKFGLRGIACASEVITAGVDLVIVAGDKLLGGPAVGLIVGREVSVRRLRASGWSVPLAAPLTTLLPLAATLELHQDAAVAERSIPLLSLLSTSTENLQNRSQRLALQLAANPLVASATAVEDTASLLATSGAEQQLSAWSVAVQPRDVTASALQEKLRAAPVSIATSVRKDLLHINLRSVLPRQDRQIVEVLECLLPTKPASESPQDS